VEAIQKVASDYMPKPFTLDDLHMMTNFVLGSAAALAGVNLKTTLWIPSIGIANPETDSDWRQRKSRAIWRSIDIKWP
jgi:hypothetical protein